MKVKLFGHAPRAMKGGSCDIGQDRCHVVNDDDGGQGDIERRVAIALSAYFRTSTIDKTYRLERRAGSDGTSEGPVVVGGSLAGDEPAVFVPLT